MKKQPNLSIKVKETTPFNDICYITLREFILRMEVDNDVLSALIIMENVLAHCRMEIF